MRPVPVGLKIYIAILLTTGVSLVFFVFGLFVGKALGAGLTSASYYGPGLYGRHTACGQVLTPGSYGIAHLTLPCGTRVRICRLYTCVVAPVIDRGPASWTGRGIDMTMPVARRLNHGNLSAGHWLVSWSVR